MRRVLENAGPRNFETEANTFGGGGAGQKRGQKIGGGGVRVLGI